MAAQQFPKNQEPLSTVSAQSSWSFFVFFEGGVAANPEACQVTERPTKVSK